MRKTFSKLVSVALSAAMVFSLGAGVVVNPSVASAEGEQVAEDQKPTTEDNGETADAEGVTYGYSAYVGFQTDGPYAFRDPCMAKNGLTNKDYKYETQCMLPVGKKDVEATDVTSVNPVMSAAGEYTTSISGIDLTKANVDKKGKETKASCFNMLYVTTNIPKTNKGVKCTNVTLKIDGKEIKTLKEAPCKPDSDPAYYDFMIADNYATNDGIDTSEIFYGDSTDAKTRLKVLPTSSIEIKYTIEGGDWSNLPLAGTLGMKFTDGDFTYKVTGAASATTAGKVQLTGISEAGKAKSSLTVPAVANEEKLTKAKYNVTSISSSAFKACTAKSVSLAKASVTSIPSKAFKGLTALTTVDLGSKIKKIPTSAFEGCKKLKTVKMSDKISSIGTKAFSGCSALASVTLGKATKKIGKNAFSNCKKLSKLAVKQKVKVTKDAFKGCKKTIKVSGKPAHKKYTVEQIKKSGYKKVK